MLGHYPKVSRQELEKMLQIRDLRETKVYQEAREEGLEQGLEQGRVETRQKIAERMLRRKIPTADIAAFTGLSAKEVERLRKKIGKRRW